MPIVLLLPALHPKNGARLRAKNPVVAFSDVDVEAVLGMQRPPARRIVTNRKLGFRTNVARVFFSFGGHAAMVTTRRWLPDTFAFRVEPRT